MKASPNRCPFLAGYDRLTLPVAHGEGRIKVRDSWILKGLEQAGQVVLRFVGPGEGFPGCPANPNGSEGDVAGLCDIPAAGPALDAHPERHVLPTHHPNWTRKGMAPEGDGLRLFRNAVEFFKD